MMFNQQFIKVVIGVILLVGTLGCSRDEQVTKDIEVNDFVWGSMNAFYKWQASVDDLSDRRFSSRNDLNAYLASFETPDALFNTVVNASSDTLSFITDDYNTLYENFEGFATTNGMKLSVTRYANNSDSLYAYVRYVVPNSDAFTKGIRRGTIFNQVNGVFLQSSNFLELLEKDTYTITEADFNSGNPTVTANNIALTESKIQENPITKTAVIEQGGKKIGYIAIHKFIPRFDKTMNTVFGDFKDQNIDHLIVDLRYNNSGAIESSTYLASMITGQFNGELFISNAWNEKVMQNINPERRNHYFTDELNNNFNPKEQINSLNLQSVYILTSQLTASASEAFINALAAYIDVKIIGTQTAGQFFCSSILYDSDDYSVTSNNLNTTHTWAVVPVVLEAFNKNNQNTIDGIIPDVVLTENPGNLGDLGAVTDPIINKTVDYILTGSKPSQLANFKGDILWSSELKNADYNLMHIGYQPNSLVKEN